MIPLLILVENLLAVAAQLMLRPGAARLTDASLTAAQVVGSVAIAGGIALVWSS